MKNRLDRVNESIKRELGALVRREITFQAKLVTLKEVDITPDEQHAALAQLHDARLKLQRELSRRIVLKFTPHLHFKLDETGERGDRILQILGHFNYFSRCR